jgi:beta-glucosidase
MQQKDENGFVKIATTIKHFFYGQSSGGVNKASMFGGVNHLLNDLAHPYVRAIQENPMSIMTAYASVDQVPMVANKWMLQTMLRGTLGFKGLIMSDALAVLDLYTDSLTANSMGHAGLRALRAGVDMELSPAQPAVYPTLMKFVDDKNVQNMIDDAVLRMLEIKFATGMFDLPLPTVENMKKTLRAEKHLEINREMSRESIVLLQNDGVLPLSKEKTSKVAVIGPFANLINAGSYAACISGEKKFGKSLYRSLKAELGSEKVQYAKGCDINTDDTSGIADAVDAAKSSGLAILMLGSLSISLSDPLAPQRTDGEFFSHADLGFPGVQQQLLDAVLATGVPTIVVLSGGQAFVLNNSTLKSNAIVHSFLGGEFTGDSLVEILFGEVNPSGKLTISMPQNSGATPINYDYLPSDDKGGIDGGFAEGYPIADWQLPVLTRDVPMRFGYGLSYTTFDISAPKVSSTGETVEVSTTVTNTGDRAGKEVVQLYFHQAYSMVERPNRSLIRFSKVMLQPGQSKQVKFEVPINELGYWIDMEWNVDRGNYTFFVGSSSKDQDLKTKNIIL